jgi:hypothetical protein
MQMTLIVSYLLIFTVVAYFLDRRIIADEGGYDERSLWRYPSTYVAMWSVPAIMLMILWMLFT